MNENIKTHAQQMRQEVNQASEAIRFILQGLHDHTGLVPMSASWAVEDVVTHDSPGERIVGEVYLRMELPPH